MAIAYKILSEIFSLCLKLFDSVFGWLVGWLDVWLLDTTLFNSVLFCFVQFYSARPSNFNQFIKIVIILIIFLYKWMDVCLLCDKLCFHLEFYQQVVDGRTTDDIFAIAIAIAIVIVIQWNSLLRFTGDSGRKRIAKEVTDVRDKSFSPHTHQSLQYSTMLPFGCELKSVCRTRTTYICILSWEPSQSGGNFLFY